MMEAFELAVPGREIVDYLDGIDFDNARSVSGAMSNWRGKYFEVIVRDELNSGGQIGDIVLGEGQKAVLAESLSQPGWDLAIIDDAGATITEFQLKAVQGVSEITRALERYPELEIVSTAEAAQQITDSMVISSDVSNDEMKSELADAVDAVVDSPLVDALELFTQGMPAILIAGSEGTMWIMGRKTFAAACSSTLSRATGTGVAMAAGFAVAAAGAGVLSIPAVFGTRLAFARHANFSQLSDHIEADTERVRTLRTMAASTAE